MQTLILIPGLGSDVAIWQRTIAAIGVAATCQIGDTLSDPTLVAMARRIINHAPPTFALAGVSMGGMVALEIMKIAPERVTRLALIDTTARSDTVGQKTYRHFANFIVGMVGDFRGLAERSISSLVHQSSTPDVRDELVEMSVRVGPKIYVRQSRALAAREDLRLVLPRVNVPVVIVVGKEDRLTPPRLAQEMHGLIPSSTLYLLHGCGHLPPIEKPEALATILKSWLEQPRASE